MNRIASGCLRIAARRWPYGLREDLIRAWHAELSTLDSRPHRQWQRLTFVASLVASPIVYDEDGVPRSRWEWIQTPGPGLRAAGGLLLAGGFGAGLWTATRILLGNALQALSPTGLPTGLTSVLAVTASAALTSGYAVVAGRWLGAQTLTHPSPTPLPARAAAAIVTLAAIPIGWSSNADAGFNGTPGTSIVAATVWTAATLSLVAATSRPTLIGRARRRRAETIVGALASTLLGSATTVALAQPATGRGLPGGVIVLAGPAPYATILTVTCFLLPLTVCAVSFACAPTSDRPVGTATPEPSGALAAVHTGSGRTPTARPARIWTPNAAQAAATAAAAGAAVTWAVGMALLQTPSEPGHPYSAQNNTYWVRELRWGAIVAIVLAVIVCARGRRRAVSEAILVGLLWAGTDIGLDRAGLSGGVLPLATAALLAAITGCFRASTAHRQGTSPDDQPSRRALLLAAGVAATLAGLAVLTESDRDTESALNTGSAATSCALGIVALGAALRAAPRLSHTRYLLWGLGTLAASATPWLVRTWYPKPTSTRSFLGITLIILLTVCCAAVAWHRPQRPHQWARYPVAAVGATVAVIIVLYTAFLSLVLLDIGGALTALAGNPPVNAADEDIIAVIPGVFAGLAAGWSLVLGERAGWTRAARAAR